MAEPPTDRRVRRTRQLLRDALMELTLERGYDRVTVQQILERADVGRSTFYTHYRDKDDLLVGEFEALHPSWAAPATGSEGAATGPIEFLEPLRTAFRDIDANRRRFKAMVGRQGSETIRRLLPEPMSNLVRDHVLASYPAGAGEGQRLAVAVHFIVGGLLGTLTWWLDTDAPIDADELFDICQRLATDGAAAFFGA